MVVNIGASSTNRFNRGAHLAPEIGRQDLDRRSRSRAADGLDHLDELARPAVRQVVAVDAIVEAGPDVYNHNLETVPRLYPTIRPGARYYASLRLLESVKRKAPHIFTKSGLMVGLAEERLEVHQVMDDMRSAGVDFLTMGQYLQPTPRHAKVEEFVTPKAFDAYAAIARAKGFLLVAASPLTRSSYHAGDDFKKMQEARLALLERSNG